MPRKPALPPVIVEVVFNPEPAEGYKASIEVLQLLIDFALKDRAAENVDTSVTA